MDNFRDALVKKIEALKANKFAAMHRAAEPYAIQIYKLEKMLSLYDQEEWKDAFSQFDKEQKNVVQLSQGNLPFDSDEENLKPREKTKKLGLNTQEMIILVLEDKQSKMLALDILAEINKRWKLGLVRSSLSPQLSRLKKKRILKDEGGYWELIQK